MTLHVALLHDDMVNKRGEIITASLTLIDIHDIARASKTYGVKTVFIAHSSPALRRLAQTLKDHWQGGFGSSYNPNRKEALEIIDIVPSFDEVLTKLGEKSKSPPILVATSARPGEKRVSFKEFHELLTNSDQDYLLMLGTGWGMSPELLAKADYFLEPINGPTEYNHLSVRSACAIMLDRLLGR